MANTVFEADFDFGFSTVSEDELKAYERGVITQTAELHQDAEEAFNKLYDMIMPLLNNLKKDPEKDYILWPERVAKIDTFIQKINTLRDTK